MQAIDHFLVNYLMPDEDELDDNVSMEFLTRAACCSGPPPAEGVVEANKNITPRLQHPFQLSLTTTLQFTPYEKTARLETESHLVRTRIRYVTRVM